MHIGAAGVSYKVDGYPVQLHLTGNFNVYNSLAALAVGEALGFPLKNAAILVLLALCGNLLKFQLQFGYELYRLTPFFLLVLQEYGKLNL